MRESVACALWRMITLILVSHIFSVGLAWRDAELTPVQPQNVDFSKAFAQVQNFFSLVTADHSDEEPHEEAASEVKEKKKDKKKTAWSSNGWLESDFIIVDPFEEEENKPVRRKKGSSLNLTPVTKETLYAAGVNWRPIGNVGITETPEHMKKDAEYLKGAVPPCQKGINLQLEVNKSSLGDLGELKASGTKDFVSLPAAPEIEDEEDESQDIEAEATDQESDNQEENQDNEEQNEPAEDLQEDDDESEDQQQDGLNVNNPDASDDPEAEEEEGDKAAVLDTITETSDKAQQAPEKTEQEPIEKENLSPEKLRSPSAARSALEEKVKLHVKEAQIPPVAAEEESGDGEAKDLREGQDRENVEDVEEDNVSEKPSNVKASPDGPKVTEDIEDTEDGYLQRKIVPTVFGINRNYQRLGVRAPYVPVPIGAESGRQLLLYKLVKVPKDVQEANRGRLKRVSQRGQPRSMRVISVKEVDPASMTLDVKQKKHGGSLARVAQASEVVSAATVAPILAVPCGSEHYRQVEVILDGAAQATEHGVRRARHPYGSSRKRKKYKYGGRSRDEHDHSDSGDDLLEDAESRYKDKKGNSHAHHDEGEHASGQHTGESSGSKHEDHAHDEGGDHAHHGHHTHSGGHEGKDNDYAEKGEDLSEHAKSKYKQKGRKSLDYHDGGESSAGKHKDVSGGSGHEDHGYNDHKMKKKAKGFRDKYNFDKTKKHDSFYSNHKKKGSWKNFGHADSYYFDDDKNDEKGKYKKEGSKNSGKGSKGFWQDTFFDDDEDEWKGSKSYDKKYGGGKKFSDEDGSSKKRKYHYKPGFYSWG